MNMDPVLKSVNVTYIFGHISVLNITFLFPIGLLLSMWMDSYNLSSKILMKEVLNAQGGLNSFYRNRALDF